MPLFYIKYTVRHFTLLFLPYVGDQLLGLC